MEQKVFQEAVKTFERMFRCSLCLHDYTGKLSAGLLPTMHVNPYCTATKELSKLYVKDCVLFDKDVLQLELLKSDGPLFKRCPMNLLECVFPVRRDNKLYGAIFAGPFLDRTLPDTFVLESKEHFPKTLAFNPPLPELPEDRGAFVSIGCALALLLSHISQDREQYPGNTKELVENYLDQNYMQNIGLENIAELLSLTTTHASKRIKKEFGQGFCVLLNERRVNAACRFLENTSFSVEVVARLSGFREASYFHRIFHRKMLMTPQEYRQKHLHYGV